jgi:hypothetical protein
MPHLHLVDAQHHLHLLANQTARHRVTVLQDADRAARSHRNLRQPPAAFQPSRRKRSKRRQLFYEPLLPVGIPRRHQLAEEPQVFLPAGKVAAATQPQGLVHRLLEMPVRRFGVAILVRLTNIDPLTFQAVVLQEISIPLMKLPLLGKIVHRRREAVAAMPPRNSP